MDHLDYCEATSNIGDYGIAIITLNRLYFMMSYRLTPPNSLSMLYGRCAGSGGTEALLGPHLCQEQASRHFGPRLLVGF
jgi:hypothetical protein